MSDLLDNAKNILRIVGKELDMMANTWHPRITWDSGLDIGHEIICWLFAKIDSCYPA